MEKTIEINTKLQKIVNNHVLRYIFFGGMTTMVNLVSYYILRTFLKIPVTPANVLSISLSILFAFVTNSKYVFHSQSKNIKEHAYEFIKFFSARLSTMFIEVGGVWFFIWIGFPDMIGKFVTQFVVLVLNYVFSRFLVFRKKERRE